MKPHTAQERNTRKLRNVGNRHGGSSAVTVGILGVAPIKIPDFDTEETARTQESSAPGSTQESSAPGPQLAGSMSRTRTWVSVGVDAGFSELLETSPPSSLTLATSGSFSPRNSPQERATLNHTATHRASALHSPRLYTNPRGIPQGARRYFGGLLSGSRVLYCVL